MGGLQHYQPGERKGWISCAGVQAHRVVAEIDRNLKAHPNYWDLLLVRISLTESDEEKKADAFIAAEPRLPMNLSYLRLVRFYRLAHGSSRHVKVIRKELERFASTYDDFPLFHVAVAQVAKREGKAQIALKHLDIAMQQSPNNIGALSARGFLALENNNIPEAAKYLAQVAKLQPNDVYARLILVESYLMAKDYSAARQMLREIRSSRAYIPEDKVRALETELEEAFSRNRR